jgi:hypothetical protein
MLCCILENYQTEDGKGVMVPEVLRKYIPGQPRYLPFVRDGDGKAVEPEVVLPSSCVVL